MLMMEQMLTTMEEGNMALVAVIFLVCCVEVVFIKAVTELSPSSVQSTVQAIEYDEEHPSVARSVAYLTGQYERPYLDDVADWEFDEDLF